MLQKINTMVWPQLCTFINNVMGFVSFLINLTRDTALMTSNFIHKNAFKGKKNVNIILIRKDDMLLGKKKNPPSKVNILQNSYAFTVVGFFWALPGN